jgi:hypothetical protein
MTELALRRVWARRQRRPPRPSRWAVLFMVLGAANVAVWTQTHLVGTFLQLLGCALGARASWSWPPEGTQWTMLRVSSALLSAGGVLIFAGYLRGLID